MPTSYPPTGLLYNDPFSGKLCAKLTDGAQSSWLQDMSGEQSASSPWAPDSQRICYAKGSGPKPEGVYVMDILTRVETHLVSLSSFNSYPVWSRDASDEVYYFQVSGGNVLIKAVHAVTGATRTIATVASNGERQKIGVNADGTVCSGHMRPGDGSDYRTILANVDGSGILAGWDITGPASGDGSLFHRNQARWINASRGTGPESGRMLNMDTLVQINARAYRLSHAAIHPAGNLIFQIDSGTLVDCDAGAVVFDKGGQGQTHPFFFPTDAGLGLDARAVFDEAPFFTVDPWPRPSLWVTTMAQAQTAVGGAAAQCHRKGIEIGMHWSASSSNAAHPHPTISPDGQKILWASDKAWSGGYTIPGGAGGPIDLFVEFLTTPSGGDLRPGRRYFMGRGLS